MGVIGRFRPATERLVKFGMSPMGEEVMEGVLGGGLVGLGLLTTDQPIEQTALQTALAMAGGVGIGMAGRRIGAGIGKAVHPQAYKDQSGLLAGLSRASGQEGMFTGMKDSFAHTAGKMKEALRGNTMDGIEDMFRKNPAAVAQEFGMSIDDFEKVIPMLRKADSVVTPKAAQAIDTMQEGLSNHAQKYQGSSNEARNLQGDLANTAASFFDHMPKPITGEHTGRMIGRAWGDEAGIAGGLGLGAYIGQQAGWESEKDRKIRMLEEELGQR